MKKIVIPIIAITMAVLIAFFAVLLHGCYLIDQYEVKHYL